MALEQEVRTQVSSIWLCLTHVSRVEPKPLAGGSGKRSLAGRMLVPREATVVH